MPARRGAPHPPCASPDLWPFISWRYLYGASCVPPTGVTTAAPGCAADTDIGYRAAMAQKLDWFSQWLGGEWADRRVINANAQALENVEQRLVNMEATVARQDKEIVRLRATIVGLVEILHTTTAFDDRELERAVNTAWERMTAPPEPPPTPTATDPYRGTAGAAARAEDDAEAKVLLHAAEDHQFNKRFAQARAIYQDIVARYPDSKQAVVAHRQIENLRGA